MSRRRCRDVEYMIHDVRPSTPGGLPEPVRIGRTGRLGASGDVYFSDDDEAIAYAAHLAAAGRPVKVSVLVHSVRGARCYAGDEGVELYREDPDASAFEEFEIKVTSHGKVS